MSNKWIFLFAIFWVNISSAQVIGEIFDKDYADKEFDNVLSYIELEKDNLSEMMTISGEYIMFNINTGIIRAIDNNRNSVQGSAVSNDEVFYKMSTSQIILLLEKGLNETTRIEMRPKTMTLTNGQFTLEYTKPCPPFCD